MNIIMLGAPGAGKGTQAAMIAEKYGIPHISTGDIFRMNIKENTELGQKAKVYIDRGDLVPDELTTNLVSDRIRKPDCEKGFILDGFPRTINQAECLDKELQELGLRIDYAIDVDVPDEVIVGRMSGRRFCPDCNAIYHMVTHRPKKDGICDRCGAKLVFREDDAPETVQKRLDVYHAQTEPLIRFYGDRDLLETLDGTRNPEEVFRDIMTLLEA